MAARQKGKIKSSEWEAILARHTAGESLANIARDYGCTAPAIRYIVNRAGARVARDATGEAQFGGVATAARDVGSVASALSARPRGPGSARTPASMHRSAEPGVQREPARRPRGLASKISTDMHDRASRDIAAFLYALDEMMLDPDPKKATQLKEATEHLMRAAARIRIQLEELD